MAVLTLWDHTTVTGPANADNASPVTLADEFRLSATGWVTKLHYWRATTADSGTHLGAVYDIATGLQVSGTLVTFPDPGTATGWMDATLTTPVQLPAGNYLAAIFHPNGGPGFTGAYWSTGPGGSGITNGILSAPNNTSSSGGQGRFAGDGVMTYPTGTFNATNYWCDVSVSTTDPSSKQGTGNTAVSLSLTAGGSSSRRGAASLSVSLAFGGTGVAKRAGTAATSTALTSTGQGKSARLGTAALEVALSVVGIGKSHRSGTATIEVSVDTMGAGRVPGTFLGRLRSGAPRTTWSSGPPIT